MGGLSWVVGMDGGLVEGGLGELEGRGDDCRRSGAS